MSHSISATEFLRSPLGVAIKRGTQPIYSWIPYDVEGTYVRRTPKYKIIKKFLHKYLYLLVCRQLGLLRSKLMPDARILMLYTGKDSFGDANMELSGRALLRGKGFKLDLLTLPKLLPQFKEDDVFQNIYTSIDQLSPDNYDAVLLSEFNHRSLRLKTRYFSHLPYACLFGYFDGPDRNQTYFSYAAFNDIFSLGFDNAKLLITAKPYIHSLPETERSVAPLLPQNPFLTVSVGGVDPYRTYQYWPAVLRLLDNQSKSLGLRHVLLIGSDNGKNAADAILQETFKELKIINQVSKLNLLQTRELISKAKLFVGCDGGLMHVAHSTSTPTVALFSKNEPPAFRITKACYCQAIQSTGSTSDIAPETIVHGIQTALITPR